MYLFTRSGQFRPGSLRASMAFVANVTEKVRQESDLDVHAWMATLSPTSGTCTWSAWVESLDELEAANDKLAVSTQFNEVVEAGAGMFAAPVRDQLATLVHGEVDPSVPLPGYVSVARAVAANGHLADSVSAGVEIAQAATEITGHRTGFLVGNTGTYGGCSWITGFDSIATLQAAEEALAADQSWLALVDRVGSRYAPGADQSIHRRIA